MMTDNPSWYNTLEFSGYPFVNFNLGPASDAHLADRAKDGDIDAGAELKRRKWQRSEAANELTAD